MTVDGVAGTAELPDGDRDETARLQGEQTAAYERRGPFWGRLTQFATVVALAAGLVASTLALDTVWSFYPGVGVFKSTPAQQPAEATVHECRRVGPVSGDGFGYWWHCAVTVRTRDGREVRTVVRHSTVTPRRPGWAGRVPRGLPRQGQHRLDERMPLDHVMVSSCQEIHRTTQHQVIMRTASSVGPVLVEHVLRREIPVLVRLLDRGHLQDIADQEFGLGYATWQVKAWLLAEAGRTEEVELILQPLEDDDDEEDEDESVFQAMRRLASSRGRQGAGGR
ncbi:DUF6346 domain-containing protein [Micromonospora ureilytica]|uniref:DUF6346 domain-containing protein n=1 Tax=Micromonospora ureilytica TaxID=709868 RepID=UPI0033E1F3C6